jgi:serine/threonine protein kinase
VRKEIEEEGKTVTKDYAMKKIKKNKVFENALDRRNTICRNNHKVDEIDMMLKLHNPYCIHIHEIILHPEEDFLYIILHLYPGGDLQK